MKTLALLVGLAMLLAGCAADRYQPDSKPLDRSLLPAPDTDVTIEGLRPCTDAQDSALQLDSGSPVTVLVHGCNGSAGRFRSLAQVYAFHGQQAVCFGYDDRDSLVDSAERLIDSLAALAAATDNQSISVLGHSMGGLVARKALESTGTHQALQHSELELVTVSAPFAGIGAAEHCGIKALHWLTLGIVPGICWAVTGDNWFEITWASDFIRRPEALASSVQRYLKIDTNEKDTCRLYADNGRCLESDDVFELAEQYHPVIDQYRIVERVQVDAGHVEIVGNKDIEPRKLLTVLQSYGLIAPTPPHRRSALDQLLAELY